MAALIGDVGKITKPLDQGLGTVDSKNSTTEHIFVPSTKNIYKLTDSLDIESQKFKSVVEFSG